MITVQFDESLDARHGRLTVSGHAGAAEKGHDVVCAAVSAIVQTLSIYLLYLHETDAPFDLLITTEGKNPAVVEYRVMDEDALPRVKAAVEMTELGLHVISGQYPAYVQFIDDPEGSV